MWKLTLKKREIYLTFSFHRLPIFFKKAIFIASLKNKFLFDIQFPMIKNKMKKKPVEFKYVKKFDLMRQKKNTIFTLL